MKGKDGQTAKAPKKQQQVKTRKAGPARCTCNVKLVEEEPIKLSGTPTGGTTASYTPNYQTEPKCSPDDCQKKVLYKWTIEVLDGTPTLTDETKEVAKVSGVGSYTLTLKVTVLCLKRIVQIGGTGRSIFRTTVCSSTGSETFTLG